MQTITRPTLKALVVDDNSKNADVISLLLGRKGFVTRTAYEPYEALRLAEEENFELALLDVNLHADLTGLDLMARLKKIDPSSTCVIMTADGSLQRIVKALELGAQGFVIKPFTPNELFEAVELALEKTRLIRQHVRMLRYAPLLESATDALLNALEARDISTKNHSQRVSYYSVGVAKAMKIDAEELALIRVGSQFHDIGKIGIPDDILLKPGPLTPEERKVMETHTEIGWKIMKGIEGMFHAAKIVRAHHERFDGRGYPDGLKGEDIPIGARIATVADCFEAMVSPRVYSRGRPVADALTEIERCSGTQFDPEVVKVFLKLMDSGELVFRPANAEPENEVCANPVLPVG